jgi:hypothetical protein
LRRTAFIALVVTVLVASGLLWLIGRSAQQHSYITPVADRIAYYKLYVDLAKAVLVGLGATLLGVLVPAIFAEARYSFERLRDSRTAYSEAKTSVDYLALSLCTLNLKDAAALVQRAHVRKHEAELYAELKIHLKRRHIEQTPEQWGDGLYARLFMTRRFLEEHAGDWDLLSPDERLSLLRKVLPRRRPEELVKGALTEKEMAAFHHYWH